MYASLISVELLKTTSFFSAGKEKSSYLLYFQLYNIYKKKNHDSLHMENVFKNIL